MNESIANCRSPLPFETSGFELELRCISTWDRSSLSSVHPDVSRPCPVKDNKRTRALIELQIIGYLECAWLRDERVVKVMLFELHYDPEELAIALEAWMHMCMDLSARAC